MPTAAMKPDGSSSTIQKGSAKCASFLLAFFQRLCYTTQARRVGISVLLQLPKLARRVRLPYPAPKGKAAQMGGFSFWHRVGVEPEGSWQGAGGALQPEVACPSAAPRRRSLRTARKRQLRKRLPFSLLCSVSPPFKIGPAALGSDFVKERGPLVRAALNF